MRRSAHTPHLYALGLSLALSTSLACSDDGSSDATTTETTGDGDGDGDTTPGDGDGDTTPGDGDGDTGDGDGDTGDGDGDTGDGDGDGDTGDGDGDGDTGDGDGDGDTGDGDGDTGDGDGDDGNLTFVPDDDFGFGDLCDPWVQDCPDGEKCVAYASQGNTWDANKCVPVMGEGQPGDDCNYDGVVEATDDCGEDSYCWNLEGNQGTCAAFCTGTPQDPMCDPGFNCLISNQGSINLCVDSCDPLSQNCGPNLGCYWVFDAFSCVFTTEDIPPGEPCGFINDCEPGALCTGAESLPNCNGANCCTLFCALDEGDAGCNALPGTECVPFFDNNQAPPGYENVGACVLP